MLEKPKRRMSARARQVVSIVTGIAVAATAATAVALLPSFASAEETPVVLAEAKPSDRHEVAPKELPEGAQRATTGPSRPGPRAKRFETRATSARIVGGVLASAADFPSVVGIRTFFTWNSEPYISTCTGSVLSPTRVLTAAHCSVDFNAGYTEVIAGRNDLANDVNGFVARVSHAWTHQGYNLQAQYDNPQQQHPIDDVTVLTLKDALPSVYTPVTLADQGAPDPADGTDATIVGYGVTDEEPTPEDRPGILRKATVDIQADADCQDPAQYGTRFDPNRMLCAGNPPVDTCYGDSGGPIFTGPADARVQVGITDWGDGCGTKYGVYEAINHYSNLIKAQITLKPANNLDWTGDGHSDLMMRARDGVLEMGSGAGLVFGTPDEDQNYDIGFSGFSQIGTGWGSYTKLLRVNNWAGDGNPSIFARDSTGRLFNWRGDGRGKFAGSPVQIGSGWNKFTDIIVTNDWIGNGLPNLMGRTADGRLVIYNSDGKGGWLNPRGTQIGTGWTKFNTVLSPGSWLGDGRQSLIGRTPAGELRLYNSNGSGGWTNPWGTKIGSGWNGFPTFMSPGDFNGDNLVDLLGVRTNGQLMLYATNGRGSWLNARGRLLGYNWNGYNVIF